MQSAQKGGVPRAIGRTKGGLNRKLHAVCDGQGRPVRLLLTAGQISDYSGARILLPSLPAAKHLLADKGYDANWFHDGLIGRGITPCIPPKKSRKFKHRFNRSMYKQRHKVENMFGRLKDWRRIATRYDRCAHTFFAAICIAAIVIWWL